MKMIVYVLAVVLLPIVESSTLSRVKRLALENGTHVEETNGSQVCYGSLGCFSKDPPFKGSPGRPFAFLPQSPDRIRTKLLLYTRDSRDTPQVLDARHCRNSTFLPANFTVRPTKFLVHGFLESPFTYSYWAYLESELLKHGDYNLFMVDWSKGNFFPYTQATANTRVVGAQIAECIHAIINATTLTVADFHLIGFSLGAHISGYAGERIPGLGRISGLDLAGPYFDGTDRRVRLDDTDAKFVDVIHTNARTLFPTLGFGTRTPSGHANYYPNLGHVQPGCDRNVISDVLEYDFIEGVAEIVQCDHVRSVRLYAESINSPCPFLAHRCASEEDFVNNRCSRSCGNGRCARMGFHADKYQLPAGEQANYYLTTGDTAPFCRYHLTVTVRFSSGEWQGERGTLKMVVSGNGTTSEKISLTEDPLVFSPGQNYTAYVQVRDSVNDIQSVTFTWDHDSSTFDFKSWNIFGYRKPKLHVDGIELYLEESGTEYRFCAKGQSIQTDQSVVISLKC